MSSFTNREFILLATHIDGNTELFWSEYLGHNNYKLLETFAPFQVGDIVYCDHLPFFEKIIERPNITNQEQLEFEAELEKLWNFLGETARNRKSE